MGETPPPALGASSAAGATFDAAALLERISDAFVALDRDWRYVCVNAKAGELFGRRPEDLLGKQIWTEFPEGVGQPFHLAYERAMAEQRTIVLDDYYAPWDRWFENRIYPSPDGLSIFFTEITERKRDEERREGILLRLAESEDRYRDLVEHSRDLICTHDLEGRVLSANSRAAQALGRSVEELARVNLREIVAPEARHLFETYLATIHRDGVASGSLRVHTATGELRFWEYENTLRTEGVAAPLVRGVARDVTERRRAEAEIQRQVVELQRWYQTTLGREDRVRELKREVDALRARLGEPPRYPRAADEPGVRPPPSEETP